MEHNDDIISGDYEGKPSYWKKTPLILTKDARLRHTFVVGQTGTGKTTLFQRMAVADLHAGNGFVFIDPHGDAAQQLIDYIPSHRMEDVLYFDPSNKYDSFGLNILQNKNDDEKDQLTQEVVNTFRYRWSDSWGARMENIFKHSIRALLDIHSNKGGATLLMLPAFLARSDYRAWVLQHSESPAVRDFFAYEFDNWNERQRSEWVQPIQNKVGAFLLSSTLRNVIGQPKSTIDVDYIMNNQKVLIVNLSKGRIGVDDANTIGSLLVTAFQMAAMRRAKRKGESEEDRIPFYGYFDEFHSITTGSFASILAESRKYGFGLLLAGQYLDQIEVPQVRSAIFGNVGNIISFRVGNDDAEHLAQTVQEQKEELVDLGTGHARVKVLQKGKPITGKLSTYPLSGDDYTGSADKVKRHSERYMTDNRLIEHHHRQWATWLQHMTEDTQRKKKGGARRRNARRGRKTTSSN